MDGKKLHVGSLRKDLGPRHGFWSTPFVVEVPLFPKLCVYRWGLDLKLWSGPYLVFAWKTGEGWRRVYVSRDATPDDVIGLLGRRMIFSWKNPREWEDGRRR